MSVFRSRPRLLSRFVSFPRQQMESRCRSRCGADFRRFSLHEQIHSDCHTSAVWPELSHYLVKTETSSSVSMNQLVITHRTGPAEPRRDISLVLLSVNRELRLCQVFESKPGWKKRSVLIHLWFCRNVLGSHLFWRSSWAFFDRAASVSEEFGFKTGCK